MHPLAIRPITEGNGKPTNFHFEHLQGGLVTIVHCCSCGSSFYTSIIADFLRGRKWENDVPTLFFQRALLYGLQRQLFEPFSFSETCRVNTDFTVFAG